MQLPQSHQEPSKQAYYQGDYEEFSYVEKIFEL